MLGPTNVLAALPSLLLFILPALTFAVPAPAPTAASSSTSTCLPRCAYANSSQPALSPALAFDRFVDAFYVQKNLSATVEYLSPGYINHYPYTLDGIPAFRKTVGTGFLNGTFAVMNRVHPPPGGTVGFVHYKYTPALPGGQAPAVVDVYRMEGSCVVEHWDVGEAVPANATNPRAMFSPPA